MDSYKSDDGRVDLDFFLDIAKETGIAPAAIREMPRLEEEYQYIVHARSELACGGGLIPYSEMQAYLVDYPEIEPKRFKALLRSLDRGFC